MHSNLIKIRFVKSSTIHHTRSNILYWGHLWVTFQVCMNKDKNVSQSDLIFYKQVFKKYYRIVSSSDARTCILYQVEFFLQKLYTRSVRSATLSWIMQTTKIQKCTLPRLCLLHETPQISRIIGENETHVQTIC